MFDSLRSRINGIIIIAITGPVILSALVFLFVLRTPLLDRIADDTRSELKHHKHYIEQWIESRASIMDFIAMQPSLKANDKTEMMRLFVQIKRTMPKYADIIFVKADGKTDVTLISVPGVDVSDRSYFLAARKGNSFVSGALVSRDTGERIIVFSAPVFSQENEFLGCVVSIVPLYYVERMLQSLRIGGEGSAFLVDGEGTPLTVSSDRTSQHVEGFALSGYVEMVPEVLTRVTDVTGDPYYIMTQTLQHGDWRIVRVIPFSAAFGMQLRIVFVLILMNLLAVALITPFLLGLSRDIARPIARLSALSTQLQSGAVVVDQECVDLDDAPAEIRTLQHNFCQMSDHIRNNLRELRRASYTDQLTGLHNRRYLAEHGERIVDICRRGNRHCCCLMADLDHFKTINDQYGHQVGDEVLQVFAQVLSTTIRWSDLVVRYGGEEFTVIAPNATLADGVRLAERIRISVEAMTMTSGTQQFGFTVSIGVAAHDDVPETGIGVLDGLVGRADRALYRAKEKGRNRVCVWCADAEATDATIAEATCEGGVERAAGAAYKADATHAVDGTNVQADAVTKTTTRANTLQDDSHSG